MYKKNLKTMKTMIGKHVIVRSANAGVFFGVLTQKDRDEVLLSDARKIWSWNGANSVTEVAGDSSGYGYGYGKGDGSGRDEVLLSDARKIWSWNGANSVTEVAGDSSGYGYGKGNGSGYGKGNGSGYGKGNGSGYGSGYDFDDSSDSGLQ